MTTTEAAPSAPTGTAAPAPKTTSNAEQVEAYARDAIDKLFGQGTAPDKPEPAPEPEPPQADLSQPGEAGAETPPEPEAAPAEDPASGEPEPTKTVSLETFQKRVDKLTAQKAEALKRAEALESELNNVKSRMEELESQPRVAPPAPSNNPLASINSETELDQYEAKSKTILRNIEKFERNAMAPAERSQFVEQLKQAGYYDPESGEADMGRLLDLKFQIEDAIQSHIPARKKYFAESRHFDGLATKAFPYLSDRTSSDFKMFEQIASTLPELQSRPNWKVIVGTLVAGLKAHQAEEATKTAPTQPKPKPVAPAPKVASAPSMVATTTVDRKTANVELRDKALRSRNPNDIEKWIASQLP
jgi:hypothetical protein